MPPAPPDQRNGFLRSPLPEAPGFGLRCADVHPVACDASWRSGHRADLVLDARVHGGQAHGFTPAWYSPRRLDAIDEAVYRLGGFPVPAGVDP